jgi:hypothetical protein
MAEYHKMRAFLYDNVLTEDPNDYMARIHSEASLKVDDVSQSAVKRGGANISAAAMTHAVNLWLKEFAYRSCDGFSVNTGWFTVQPVIRGVFNSPNEKFNPAKHTVVFDFQQGSLMRRELAGVQVQIMGVADTSAFIAQVTDVKTGSVNDLLTPNRNLRISGSKIKIAGDSPGNGVWFVNSDTQQRTKVDPTDMVTNNPSELIIVIPALPAGIWQLEVVTQFSTGGKQTLKEPRTATFDKILTVEQPA